MTDPSEPHSQEPPRGAPLPGPVSPSSDSGPSATAGPLPEDAPPPEAAPLRTGWVEAHPREMAWILAGVALLIRLVYLFQLRDTPYHLPDRLDPLFYFDWGRTIASGHWIGDKIFIQSPLYAYVIAVFLKIFSERWIFPTLHVFQALVGVGTCLLTVRIGRRVLGERPAWAAGFLAALYGPFLFYDGMVMKTFLSTFFTVLLVDLLLASVETRGTDGLTGSWGRQLVDLLLSSKGTRARLLLLSGFVFALTSLVRDNFVLLLPLLLAGIFVAFNELPAKRRLGACLLFVAGAAAGILPVTVRNFAVGHEFALLTTGGGEVFFIGNNADANGRYLPPPFVHADPRQEHEDFIAKARELSGKDLTPGESSHYWLRQGLSWIGSHPGSWLRLLLRKLTIFWNYYELPDNYNYYEVREVVLRPGTLPGWILFVPLTFLTFAIVAPLGIVGIALSASAWRKLLLIYLVLFGYMGTVLLFFNFSRFRVPIVPFLCLFAGVTLTALAREAKDWALWLGQAKEAESRPSPPAPWQRILRRPWVLAYPVLFLAIWIAVNYLGTSGRGVFPALQTERNLGDTFRLQGRFVQAEREYRRGLQILGDEPMDPATAASLGVDPARMRQEVENERMAQGVNFTTVRAGLHFGLGALWVDEGKKLLETDRGKAEDLIRRGITEMETAAKAIPYAPFLRRLAEAYDLLGQKDRAEKTYLTALNLTPGDFALHYDLAGLYYGQGRYPDALKQLQEAVKAKGVDKKSLTASEAGDYHYGLGLLYLDGFQEQGKALYHLQKALESNPAHREAKRIRQLIRELTAAGAKPVASD